MSIVMQLGPIPGPKPHFIFGNSVEIHKEGLNRVFLKWTKQYGPIVAFYIGVRPQMLISDLNLIQQAMIKDFHLFTCRNQILPDGAFPLFQKKNTSFHEVNAWKQIRSVISTSFSISKLKSLEPLILASLDNLIIQLDEKSECGEESIMEPMM